MENNINNISQEPSEQKGVGPIIGLIIIIIVVIAGGFYFWGSKIAKNRQATETENKTINTVPGSDLIENKIDVNQLDIPLGIPE